MTNCSSNTGVLTLEGFDELSDFFQKLFFSGGEGCKGPEHQLQALPRAANPPALRKHIDSAYPQREGSAWAGEVAPYR